MAKKSTEERQKQREAQDAYRRQIKQERAERRERQRLKELEKEEKYMQRFHCIGFQTKDELQESLYEETNGCKTLEDETVENGFPDELVWKTCSNEFSSPEMLHISECKGKYIFWISTCITNGTDYELPADEFADIFDTLEEARAARDKIEKGQDPIETQIQNCLNALDDKAYFIKAEYGCQEGTFSIFYEENLILDGCTHLPEPDEIRKSTARYQEFREKLEAKGVTLLHTEKLVSCQWGDTHINYLFDVRYKGSEETLLNNNPSHTQNSEPIDDFPDYELYLFKESVDLENDLD